MTPPAISQIDEKERNLALELLAEGSVTVSDVAALVKQSRQLVHHWAKRAGIDPIKCREDYLRRLWFARLKKRKGK
ncbi:MAG: hypothetical protein IPK23_15040 [Rhizobiales bacterium]|nr:hypothetical protein [Hyphomicrobiales bacterium]